MVEIKLPYDKKSIVAKIPDENFAGLLESKAENFHNPLSEEETVERSMDNPIGSPTLEELAKGKKDIVLISSVPHSSRSFSHHHSNHFASYSLS